MLRSAAKNFADVAVVTECRGLSGAYRRNCRRTAERLSLKTRWQLARKAFATTAAYDSAIASTLEMLPSGC